MRRKIKFEQDVVGHAEKNHEQFSRFYKGKLIINIKKSDPERDIHIGLWYRPPYRICPFCGKPEYEVARKDQVYNRCCWCLNWEGEKKCSFGTNMKKVKTWFVISKKI